MIPRSGASENDGETGVENIHQPPSEDKISIMDQVEILVSQLPRFVQEMDLEEIYACHNQAVLC